MKEEDKKTAGIVIGLTALGIIAALLYTYRDKIFGTAKKPDMIWCDKESVFIPKTDYTEARCGAAPSMKFCEKENKNIPEAEYTPERCIPATSVRHSISGIVKAYMTDAVLPDTTVTIKNTDTNETMITHTDADGNFALLNKIPGNYTITYAHVCYGTTGPLSFKLETQDIDRSTELLKIKYEDLRYDDWLGGGNRQLDFCEPRTVSSVYVKMKFDSMLWVDSVAQILLLNANGTFVRLGEISSEHDITGAEKFEYLERTFDKTDDNKTLTGLGKFTCLYVKHSQGEDVGYITATVTFVEE